MSNSMLVLKTNASAGGKGLGYYLDRSVPGLAEQRPGVWVFDLGTTMSWPSLAAPANGAAVRDIAGNADGDVLVASGQSLAYAGGGFDFSGVALDGCVVRAPASSIAQIFADQLFMVICYVKLPSAANWNTNATILPFFCASGDQAGYTADTDLVTISQRNTPELRAARQTDGSTVVSRPIDHLPHVGRVTQVMFARTQTHQIFRARSAGGVTRDAVGAGAKNLGNFSTKRPQFGVPLSFSAPQSIAAHATALTGFRLYRGMINNLAITGADPDVLADADWHRVMGGAAPRFS